MDSQLQLHDIHLPADPNIWPLAIGWWILMLLFFMLAITCFLKVKKMLRIKEHRKILRAEYASLEKKLIASPDKNSIAETNVLLRRFALAYYPENNIASLTGDDWLHFLDQSIKTEDFSRGAGRILIEAPYRASELENYKSDEFIPLIHSWVEQTIRKVGGRL